MALAFTNLGASASPDINDNTDSTIYLSASITPPTSGLCFAFNFGRVTTGSPSVPAVSGWGLTWTQIATRLFGGSSSNRLTLFAADLTGASTGVMTFDWTLETQLGCKSSFFYCTGADLTGGVAAAFVQSPVNSGTAATSGSVTLAAAASSNNRPISCFGHLANEATTPQTSWTEVDDLAFSTPVAAMETQYRDDAFDTAAAATWTTSAVWGGIAAEIKAATTGRTTKNTDPRPLGEFTGISRRMTNTQYQMDPSRKFFIPQNMGKILAPAGYGKLSLAG